MARINGKQAEGAKLSIEVRTPDLSDQSLGHLQASAKGLSTPYSQVLRTSLQKELALGKGQASAMDLLRCPALRRLFLCLSMLW